MNEDHKNSTDNAEASSDITEADKLKDEVTKWKNDFLYLKAEFDNYKKHAIKERSDLLRFGAERISRDILEVVDNFERALEIKLTPETAENFKKGVEMIAKELKDALSKHGIQEVPALGQPFSPHFFEAISSEATTKYAEGSVSQVFRKAYKLHDKVIRMGQVVVATTPNGSSAQDGVN